MRPVVRLYIICKYLCLNVIIIIVTLQLQLLFTAPFALQDKKSAADSSEYLGVFLVPTINLRDTLFGAFGGGRGRKGLLHPDSTLSETALDAEGLV